MTHTKEKLKQLRLKLIKELIPYLITTLILVGIIVGFYQGALFLNKMNKIEIVKVEHFENEEQKQLVKTTSILTKLNSYSGDYEKVPANVRYFTKDNKLVAKEYYNNSQDFLKNNKSGMTLITNNGIGTKVHFKNHKGETVEYIYNDKLDKNEFNEVNTLIQLHSIKTNNQISWVGETDNNANSVKFYTVDDHGYNSSIVNADGSINTYWTPILKYNIWEYRLVNNKMELINKLENSDLKPTW